MRRTKLKLVPHFRRRSGAMCVHDSARRQVRAALSSTARMLFLVGWRSLCMFTCACDAVPRHLAQKIQVMSLRAGARAPLSDRVRNVRREICYRKRTGGKCGCETPSSSFMHVFGSLSTPSVLRLTEGLLRGVRGSIRSLCRTTVASLKFTRTAGNRRPFIDCSFSRSEALSPSFFLALSPPERDRMIRARRSAG